MQESVENIGNDSPWLGLASYQEKNADIFFGRKKESDDLYNKIYDHVASVVYGVSGVGKTSLLLAGVFPRLRQKQFFPVYLRLDHRKSAKPYLEQVIDGIRAAMEEGYCSIKETAPLPEQAPESLWTWLHRHEFHDVMDIRIRPVIVFDQFEEIFTIPEKDDAEIDDFKTQVCDAAADHLPKNLEKALNDNKESLAIPLRAEYRVVLAMRDDFIGRLDDMTRDCPALRDNRTAVKAMSEENAKEVVCNKRTAAIVDGTVGDCIIRAVSERSLRGETGKKQSGGNGSREIEPALLSLFCEQIDALRKEQNLPRITEELVLKNKDHILVNFYDGAMRKVSASTREKIEDKLVTSSGYRWLQASDELGIGEEDLKKLVDMRLLRTDSRNGVRYVELCHDVLCDVVQKKRDERIQRKKEEEFRANQRKMEEELKARTREAKSFRRRLRNNWAAAVWFAGLIPVAIYFLFFYEYKAYYKNWLKIYGVPHGFNRLSEKIVAHRDASYEFRTDGVFDFSFNWKKPFKWNDWKSYIPLDPSLPKRVTIVDNRFQAYPSDEKHFNTYIWSSNNSSEANKLSGTSDDAKQINISDEDMKSVVIVDFYYEQTKDPKTGVKKPKLEIGKNKKGNMVWAMSYIDRDKFANAKRNNTDNKKIDNNKVNGTGITIADISESHDEGKDVEEKDRNPVDKTRQKQNIESKRTNYEKHEKIKSEIYFNNIKTDALVVFTDSNGFPIIRKIRRKDSNECYDGLSYVGINYYPDNSDNPGYEKERMWFNPMPGEKSLYVSGLDDAYKLEFNYTQEKGYDYIKGYQITSLTYNNGNFERFNDAAGNCSAKYIYDKEGNLSETYYFDSANNPIQISKDYSDYDATKMNYDNYGNLTNITYWKQKTKEKGYSQGIHEIIYNYDKLSDGKMTKTLLSLPGHGVMGSKEFMRLEIALNESRQVTEQVHYASEKGQELACDSSGICRIVNEYDDNGVINSTCLYSLPGQGIFKSKDVMRVVRTFNKNGDILEEWNYASEKDGSKDLACDVNGICHAVYHYDEKGNETSRTLYSLEDKGVWDDAHIMRVEIQFNSSGKRVKEEYFGTKDGKDFVVDDEGICRISYKYDENSVERQRILYSMPGQGLFGNKGVMRTVRTFNENGNILEERHYASDNDEDIAPNANGFYKTKYEYDENGKLTYDILYTMKGKGAWGQKNVVRVERQYNKYGKIIEQTYYGSENGSDTVCGFSDGIYRGICIFDKNGVEQKRVLYSKSGIGIGNNESVLREEWTYNKHRQIVEEKYYASENGYEVACKKNGIHKIISSYHENGKPERKTFYSCPGHGILGKKDFMRMEREYNMSGKIVEEWHYATEDGKELTCDKDGISHYTNIYNSFSGKLIKDILYSLDDKGVFDYEGVMRVERIYDLDGKNVVEQTYYASKEGDELAFDNEGAYKIISSYHKNGKTERKIYYSSPKHGINGNNNIMRMERTFNTSGDIVEEWHYATEDGKELACDENGISHYKNIYNEFLDNLKMDIQYSLPDKGVFGYEGVMRIERIFDLDGENVVEQTYYASEEGDAPAFDNEGAHKIILSYHDNGKTERKIYYSLPGHGIQGQKDVMRMVMEFDEEGNMTKKESYNQQGEMIPILPEK